MLTGCDINAWGVVENGYAWLNPKTALSCDYEARDCYMARVHPVIKNMSSTGGWNTGGQLITVKGHGFASGKVRAYVDEVECRVTRLQDDEFEC